MTDKENNKEYFYYYSESNQNKNKKDEEQLLKNNENIEKNKNIIKNNSNKNFSKISINCKSLFDDNSLIKKRFMTPKRIIPDRLIIKIGKNDYEPKRKSIFDISKPFKKKKKCFLFRIIRSRKKKYKIKKIIYEYFSRKY